MRERNSKLRLRFAVDVFDEVATALGLATDADRARFLDVNETTYHRVSRGTNMPSNEFIAAARFAMRQLQEQRVRLYRPDNTIIAIPGMDELFPDELADKPLPGEELSPVLTRPEAAAYLKVGLSTLDGLYKSGELKHVRIGGSVRIRREDARAYLDGLKPGPVRVLQHA